MMNLAAAPLRYAAGGYRERSTFDLRTPFPDSRYPSRTTAIARMRRAETTE